LAALFALTLQAADPQAALFEKAVAALTTRDYATAEAGFQQVLKSQPNHIGALGNLGVVYTRTARFDRAIVVYAQALKLAPQDPGLQLNLGLAYMKQESYAEALPLFAHLAQNPRNLQARELLATTQLHLGQSTAAVASLATLRTEDPANTGLLYMLGIGYLKLKQPDQARQALEEFLATAPPAQANFVLCKAYYESERFDEAAPLCRKTLETDARFPGAHLALGKVLVSQRDPAAITELEAAVHQNPTDSEAIYYLGAAQLQAQTIPEGVRNLERARQLNPSFWGSYFYLGKAKLQTGQTAEAIALFQKAAERNASESAVFYQLGRALAAAGRNREAAEAMQRVKDLKAIEHP